MLKLKFLMSALLVAGVCALTPTVDLWSNRWWPVGFVTELKKEPQASYLLGAPIVTFHDGSSWRTMVDRCPHRFARLSEGRVVDGGIECPYHGWTFDGATGDCLRIPQQEAKKPECAGTALETQERNGMVFAHAGPLYGRDSSEGDLSKIALDAIFRNEKFSGTDYSRDLPMDATILAENVLDPSHLPFTHHKTISKRSNAGPLTLTKVRSDRNGFEYAKKTGSVRFEAPSLIVSVTDRGPESYKDWNVVYAVPTTPGHCRLYVRVVFQVDKIPNRAQRFILKTIFDRLPTFVAHLSNHRVLEDDNVFLHHQNREYVNDEDGPSYDDAMDAAKPGVVPLRPLFPHWRNRLYLPTSADACVVAYRRWLDDFTAGFGPVYSPYLPLDMRGQPAPASMDRADILERRRSHTDRCKSCTNAKMALQKVNVASKSLAYLSLLAVVSFVVGGFLKVVFTLLSLVFFGVHLLLDQRILPEFDTGLYPPPRNQLDD